MTTPTTTRLHPDVSNPRRQSPGQIPGWMSVSDARAALNASGQPSLPVVGHRGLIGMITLEALGGGGCPPDPDAPVASVMDWHLVRVPPGTDEDRTLHIYTEAAWTWLRNRGHDAAPDPPPHAVPPTSGPVIHGPGREVGP